MKLSRFDSNPEAVPFIESAPPVMCGHPPYDYVCKECKLPGVADVPTTRVHPGDCERRRRKRKADMWRAKNPRTKR